MCVQRVYFRRHACETKPLNVEFCPILASAGFNPPQGFVIGILLLGVLLWHGGGVAGGVGVALGWELRVGCGRTEVTAAGAAAAGHDGRTHEEATTDARLKKRSKKSLIATRTP